MQRGQVKLGMFFVFVISSLVCAFGQELDWPTYLRIKNIVLDGPEPLNFHKVEYYTILRFEPDDKPEWQIRIAKLKQAQGFDIVYRSVSGPKNIGAQVDEIVKKTGSTSVSIATMIPVRERQCHVRDSRLDTAVEALKSMQIPLAVGTKQYLTGFDYTLTIRGPSEDLSVSRVGHPPDPQSESEQAAFVQWMIETDRLVSRLCRSKK